MLRSRNGHEAYEGVVQRVIGLGFHSRIEVVLADGSESTIQLTRAHARQLELKVGDTVQDVAEGRNVGALTLAVTSGTQSAETLEKAGPVAVLPSVAELPDWLVAHGYVAHKPTA